MEIIKIYSTENPTENDIELSSSNQELFQYLNILLTKYCDLYNIYKDDYYFGDILRDIIYQVFNNITFRYNNYRSHEKYKKIYVAKDQLKKFIYDKFTNALINEFNSLIKETINLFRNKIHNISEEKLNKKNKNSKEIEEIFKRKEDYKNPERFKEFFTEIVSQFTYTNEDTSSLSLNQRQYIHHDDVIKFFFYDFLEPSELYILQLMGLIEWKKKIYSNIDYDMTDKYYLSTQKCSKC